jgi:hypothetical protein
MSDGVAIRGSSAEVASLVILDGAAATLTARSGEICRGNLKTDQRW